MIMKRMTFFILCILLSFSVLAQEQKQKGIVRTQSFVSKPGTRVVGAVISRSDENVNPAISVKTPEEGYFELSMENLDNAQGIYSIKSVTPPKGMRFKLMYPLPDDRLEYSPNTVLPVILQSYKELDEYADMVKEQAEVEAKARFDKEIAKLEKECEAGRITVLEKDRKIAELQQKLDNFSELIYEYIYETLEKTDFESLNSRHREISIAMESGDYARADSLLNWRTNQDRRAEFDDAKRDADSAHEIAEAANALANVKDKNLADVTHRILLEKDMMIQNAFNQFDYDKALDEMKDRLYYDSTNVNYLRQIGELYEIRYNNFKEALSYYQKALRYAYEHNDTDVVTKAACHNHLGDVHNTLCEYDSAEEHYSQAFTLLEALKDQSLESLYDSYLGLALVNHSQADFGEALRYYKRCVSDVVKDANAKAYWQGKIGIAHLKWLKGDYQGAKSDFTYVLNNILETSGSDIVTVSHAYVSMIDCLSTIGQFHEAIDYCNEAIKIIEHFSSSKNTYLADVMNRLAVAYFSIGKIEAGEACMNEAVNIYKNIFGEDHPNFANACVLFAHYYLLMGQLDKSEEMSDKAIELITSEFGENHLHTVDAHLAKCQLYITRGENEKAQSRLDIVKSIYDEAGLWDDYRKMTLSSYEGSLQTNPLKAIDLYKEAIATVKRTHGKDASTLTMLYNQLAMIHLGLQENEKAKVFLDQSKELADRIYGIDSPVAIMKQMELGQYYVNKGEYHKAYELYSQIEKVAVDVYGRDNYQLCNLYGMIGDYWLSQYNFEQAKYYYDLQYDIVSDTYGDEHYFLADPVSRLGAYHLNVGELYEGLEKAKQAYNILSSHFGIGHKETLFALLRVCSSYITLGKFDDADSLLKDLSKSLEKEFGKEIWDNPSIMQLQAHLHQSRGEHQAAIAIIKEAIEILEKDFGPMHSNTMQLYKSLGQIYMDLCDFKSAMEYTDISISIATRYFGKDNVGVMAPLMHKGKIYAALSRIKEAHQIYDQVKDTYIRHYGDSCKMLCDVWMSEAQLLVNEGYAEKALELLESAREHMVTIYGENSVVLCRLYNQMANAYYYMTQFKFAREYYQKSLDIVQNTLGRNNMYCIEPLMGLGNVCISEDATGQQIHKAKQYLTRASFISASVYGADNPKTTLIDSQIGDLSLLQGDLRDAYTKYMKQSMSLVDVLGEYADTHQSMATSHLNIGMYYIAKANEATYQMDSVLVCQYAEQALEEFELSENICESIYGKDNPSVVSVLQGKAQAYLLLSQPEAAIEQYKHAADITFKHYGYDSPLAAQAYATLASVCKYEGDREGPDGKEKLEDARDYFLKAISMRLRNPGNDKEMIITSTADWRVYLASTYMSLKDYDDALKMMDGVIWDLEQMQLDSKFGLYNCYYTKSNMIFQCEGDYEEAHELLKKAESLLPELVYNNKQAEDFQKYQLSFAFAVLNERMNKIDDALKYYEESLDAIRKYAKEPTVRDIVMNIEQKIESLRSL